MFDTDVDWMDARYFRPAKNGRYRVISNEQETRATYRDGKWSCDVEAFKGEYVHKLKEKTAYE